MHDILKQADELVNVLTLRIRHYEQVARTAEKAASESVDAKRLLEGKLTAVAEREEAVQQRETALGEIEGLKKLEARIQGDKTALAAKQETFAKEQAAAQKTLDDAEAALQAARAKIAEREKKLDEDRKAYKLTMMKQLIDAGWAGPKTEE